MSAYTPHRETVLKLLSGRWRMPIGIWSEGQLLAAGDRIDFVGSDQFGVGSGRWPLANLVEVKFTAAGIRMEVVQ